LAKDALLILTIGQAVCSIFGSAPVYLNRETTYISENSVSSSAKFRLKQIFNSDLWDAGAATACISSLF
jgi:hypothetical protein